MTPITTWLRDSEVRGRVIRWLLGLAAATIAVLVLGWTGRSLISAWSHPATTVASEAGVTGDNLASTGGHAIQNVGQRGEARPYLGITYVPVSNPVAVRYGLEVDWGILVTAAAEGGPADRAGVRAGDVLLFFDEEALVPGVSFLGLLWHRQPGATVKLVVWREGKHFSTEAVLGSL